MSDSAISIYYRISKSVKGLVKELLVSIEKNRQYGMRRFFFNILCNIFWVIQLIKILFTDFLKRIKRLSYLKQWKFISILTVLKGQGVISRKP